MRRKAKMNTGQFCSEYLPLFFNKIFSPSVDTHLVFQLDVVSGDLHLFILVTVLLLSSNALGQCYVTTPNRKCICALGCREL